MIGQSGRPSPSQALGEGPQGVGHLVELASPPFEFRDMRLRDGLHVGVAAVRVAPEAEQHPDAVQREAEVPGHAG